MAFNENSRVKIPAILHLCSLGYEYLSLKSAKWDSNTNIFTDIFEKNIMRLNPEMDNSDLKILQDKITLN
jgi:type I restriction enzyme R subunit